MVALVLLGTFAVPGVSAFTPPPPEFADVGWFSGVTHWVHKWTPRHGEATSTLDILPPGSAAVGDFNGDGWADMFVPALRYTDPELDAARDPHGTLWFNDGSVRDDAGRFLDVTDVSGIDARGYAYAATWADVDDDGDQDLFVGGYRMARMWSNDGDGTFTEITDTLALPQDGFVLGAAFGDPDTDGDLDLFLVQFADYTHPDDGLVPLGELPGRTNTYLRNDGGSFVDATAAAGFDGFARRTTSAAWVDFDTDGDLDLYATSYGQGAEAYRNLGDGTFTEIALALGLADGARTTCQAWEDLDRDGRLDLFVAHEDGVADGVYLGGPAGFTAVSGTLGLGAQTAGNGWGCAAFDYDGDGDMDLVTIHSEHNDASAERATLMMNRMDEAGNPFTFVDITPEAGDDDIPGYPSWVTDLNDPLAASGLAVIDWDNTGAPDLAVTRNGGGVMHMMRSVGWTTWAGTGHVLDVDLVGTASNADGLGAKVRVFAGHLDTTRQAGTAMSWGSQTNDRLRFGLHRADEGGYKGDPTPINVEITWPSGIVDVHHDLPRLPPTTVRFIEGGGYETDTMTPRPGLALLDGELGFNRWYVSENVKLGLTAVDTFALGSARSGVASLAYSRDGANWTGVADPGSTTPIAFSGDGVHRLWVRVVDHAGNDVTYLYPVRIDTTPPEASVLEPAIGSIYAQGRVLAEDVPGLDRALVVAPAPTGAADGVGGLPGPVDDAVGSDGWQHVRVDASDQASGVSSVFYRVLQTNGRVPDGMEGMHFFGPYTWDWPVLNAGPGEFRIETRVMDHAGHWSEYVHKVEIVPTTPEGLTAQPSNPTLP